MKKLIQKIVEFFFAWYSRWQAKTEVIDVGEKLSHTMTALLIAPERPEEFMLASEHLDDLQRVFPGTQFYYMFEKAYGEAVKKRSHFQILTYSNDEMYFFGLPKSSMVEGIKSRSFDVVIDLNNDFSLMAAYVTMISDAKLRICLHHDKRDTIYNFQLRTNEDYSIGERFASLIKCLASFQPSANGATARVPSPRA